jgi:hypothetical protein
VPWRPQRAAAKKWRRGRAAASTSPANWSASQYRILSGSGAGGTTYSDRFIGWGRWFSWLYWQPFRAGMGDPLIDLGAQFFGWLIIFLMIFAAGYGVARLEWMWLALLVYCAALSLNWPNVNSRYYVPIFFLLLIGMLRAAEGLRSFGNKWWRGPITLLFLDVPWQRRADEHVAVDEGRAGRALGRLLPRVRGGH